VPLLGVKRNVLHILNKSTLGDCLNHSTRVVVRNSNVRHLLNNEVKSIELGLLGDGLEQIPLKLRHPRGITLFRCQGLPYDPMKNYHLRLDVCDSRSIEARGLIHGGHLA
jgi:hypothetical protein